MEYTTALLVGIIFALVALAKYMGTPKKILPVLSLVLGLAAGLFYSFPGDPKAGVLAGVMMGLAASGFYSGGKTVLKKEDEA